jgi:hypothetical protein
MNKRIKNLGKSGIIYRKGKELILYDVDNGDTISVTVIQHDSMQGFLAENKETGDWGWYREPGNKEFGWEGPYYKVVK